MSNAMEKYREEQVVEMLRKAARAIPGDRDPSPSEERVLAGVTDFFFGVESPLGDVYVAAGREGVKFLSRTDSAEEFARLYRDRFGRFVSPADEQAEELRSEISAALAEGRTDVPLDLSQTTPFQRRVMEVVRGIRRGEVRPYAWVAREAGSPGAVRAVGNTMAGNPIPLLVPCHRVVRNDGHTGNYGFGAGEKIRLLELEGVSTGELARAPYVATPTTGIFCHATCRSARRIRPENRQPFRSVVGALDAGYRPCKVCRPAVAA